MSQLEADWENSEVLPNQRSGGDDYTKPSALTLLKDEVHSADKRQTAVSLLSLSLCYFIRKRGKTYISLKIVVVIVVVVVVVVVVVAAAVVVKQLREWLKQKNVYIEKLF
ncbi:hypothetical protein ElyMa_005294700 [Elysia marginata]|uniref:Uncharacterized protein n=1 Tax=Elysia marginata TaxID=1093978 RepID=A0AAV4JY78_9GAST|nr:hypothetical protein ElyMa_005294700 [Elysia marginata]